MLTVPQNGLIILHTSAIVDVPDTVSKYYFTNYSGLSFPSTNSYLYIIILSTQNIVWYSFPAGGGFLGKNTHTGQVKLLVHIEMD